MRSTRERQTIEEAMESTKPIFKSLKSGVDVQNVLNSKQCRIKDLFDCEHWIFELQNQQSLNFPESFSRSLEFLENINFLQS